MQISSSILKKSVYISLCLISLTFNVNADISIQDPIVRSYIGQPLSISIPVTADAADWDTLWGTIETSTGEIPVTSWSKPYNSGNIGYIDVKTTTPMTSSVVDLIVRVESIKHKIITNYPILLENSNMAPNAVTSNISTVKPVIQKDNIINLIIENKSATQKDNTYKVKSGDNLYTIAKRYKSPGQSTLNMMQYIYKNNKNAFGKTMNMLYTGKVLVL